MEAEWFVDRADAGRRLAQALAKYRARSDVLVLALPRGGVPVAAQVARALECPLDIVVVRKLGTPGQPELAMGAIASGGIRVLNPDVLDALALSQEDIEDAVARERIELERRERAYRGDRPTPEIRGRTIILVDDGIATGSTIRAAADALKTREPARLVIAAPVGSPDTVDMLRRETDEVVCLLEPQHFFAISPYYRDFAQVGDDEVRRVLQEVSEDRA